MAWLLPTALHGTIRRRPESQIEALWSYRTRMASKRDGKTNGRPDWIELRRSERRKEFTCGDYKAPKGDARTCEQTIACSPGGRLPCKVTVAV